MKDDEAQQDPPAAPGPEPRLRLRSLKVHQFREVKPGTSLEFGEGFHLILGKNATGKSTLLELLAAVSALDFRGPFFAETPFHLEASFTIGEVALHAEVRRTYEAQRVSDGPRRRASTRGSSTSASGAAGSRGSACCTWRGTASSVTRIWRARSAVRTSSLSRRW